METPFLTILVYSHLMTDENRPINLADEVATRVVAALSPRLDNQDRQLAAIRKVLDEDTATSKEVASIADNVASLQSDLTMVKSDVRGVGGQLRRLQSRLDRAEIPAE